MNGNLVLRCVAVFAAGGLLLAGSASAQTSGIFKVSDTIEGPPAAGVTAARCGTNIVVGFGDSESGVKSFDGYAVSTDNGKSFRDFGVLPVSTEDLMGFGPDLLGSVLFQGSPGAFNRSLACANSSRFYYASTFQSDSIPCIGFPICSAISVSNSTDGGKSWSLPSVVDRGSADTHNLLSPSIAVDPSNPQRLYIAYLFWNTNGPFDEVFPDCAFADLSNGIMAIRVATSLDGGATWKQALVEDSCAAQPNGIGQLVTPTIAVSATGQVYVAYEFLASQFSPGPFVPNEIHFAGSTDHGQTFGAPLKISSVIGQNVFPGLAFPQLAVDRTNSPHRGQIFLTWSDEPAGTYTSVVESDSLNGGLSFSFPRPVNGTPGAGLGRFQASPVIAVDNDGQVQICYYNTPTNTPTSTSVYSYNCATSFNHAATWQLQRVANSAPVGYDAVTSDFLTHHDGFFNAFELQTNGVRHVVGQFSDIN
jgi:hypothetical protein